MTPIIHKNKQNARKKYKNKTKFAFSFVLWYVFFEK